MERLTYWCEDGMGGGEYRVNENGAEYSGHFIDRLAAYEDTGLEPEDIEIANKVIVSAFNLAANSGTDMLIERLKEIIRAEAEGRLLVLPCKVGDAVYTAQRGVISELSVDHLELYNVGIWVGWHLMSGLYGNFRMDGFPASDIGKTVFLTREEAEAALGKEVEGDG